MRSARRSSPLMPPHLPACRSLSTPHVHHTQLRSLRFLSLVGLLLALWACSSGGVYYSHRVSGPRVTHLPASQLQLALWISGQYSESALPTVQFTRIEVYEGSDPQAVGLALHARLTCNSRDITPDSQSNTFTCRRQPPGGVYQIAYTDEHGATTTVMVHVPLGVFDFLSPQAGSVVHIPTNGVLPVRFSIPKVPAQGSVHISSFTAACGDPAQPYACGMIMSNLPDSSIITPSVSGFGPPSAPPVPLSCAVPPPLPDSLVTLSADQGTAILTGDFSQLQSLPGRLELDVKACIMPDPAGFEAVRVTFTDVLAIPITWAR